jgi:hypothetical protein
LGHYSQLENLFLDIGLRLVIYVIDVFKEKREEGPFFIALPFSFFLCPSSSSYCKKAEDNHGVERDAKLRGAFSEAIRRAPLTPTLSCTAF